jgi:endothelin-converting enzyme/putative endopeptidase
MITLLSLFLAVSSSAYEPLPPVFDASALDRSADPCGDFYQFACGTWLKENPVPGDEHAWYRFSLLDEHTRRVLRAILAEAAAEKPAGENARKIGDYYAACVDEAGIEAQGLEPMKGEFERIAALKDKGELAGMFARLQQLGAGPGLSFGAVQDYTDASKMIADADQGGWSLPDRDYYLLDDYKEDRAAYAHHVAAMFALAGDTLPAASAEAATVLKLETALAKGAMGRVERREPKNVHHKMKVAELAALTPSLSWRDYLAAAGTPPFADLDVSDPDFFKGLEGALIEFPVEDWKVYLKWNALHGSVPMLPKAFVEEDFSFFGKRLNGQQELKARWKRCVDLTDAGLGEALGRVYVESEFGPAAKERTLAMVHAIEDVMRADIGELGWMGEATKERARAKLASVMNKIGYPDKWRDYSKLRVVPGEALGNYRRAEAFEFARVMRKIGKPVDRGEWDMTPPTDNAYYDPQMNSINFPAGILQLPNFDLKADTAAILGAVGATIGHELTHGFDDEGRHYDAAGNLADWWTEADSKGFEKRAQGFVDEYAKFESVKGVKLNGKLTLGENIADNGGLILAYRALEKALKGARDPMLDGFDQRQRFFISYGQSWCENETEASLRKAAKVNPHSPGKWRVNGVVLNMPEFAKAFSCKEGAPMAPVERSRVW